MNPQPILTQPAVQLGALVRYTTFSLRRCATTGQMIRDVRPDTGTVLEAWVNAAGDQMAEVWWPDLGAHTVTLVRFLVPAE